MCFTLKDNHTFAAVCEIFSYRHIFCFLYIRIKETSSHLNLLFANMKWQEARGRWAVYYTEPQSFNNFFLFVDLTTLGTFNEL